MGKASFFASPKELSVQLLLLGSWALTIERTLTTTILLPNDSAL